MTWPRRAFLGATLTALGATWVEAQVTRIARTRTRNRGGIPAAYRYQAGQVVGPVTGRSQIGPAIRPLTRDPFPNQPLIDPASLPFQAIKTFRLIPSTLVLDHCALAGVAMTLRDDGVWSLSFVATQNAPFAGTQGVRVFPPVQNSELRGAIDPPIGLLGRQKSALNPQGRRNPVFDPDGRRSLQTSQLKRNFFLVQVRGYNVASIPQPGEPRLLGDPALFEIALDPFLVEKGVPKTVVKRGSLEQIRRLFNYLDVIEVSLAYQDQVSRLPASPISRPAHPVKPSHPSWRIR